MNNVLKNVTKHPIRSALLLYVIILVVSYNFLTPFLRAFRQLARSLVFRWLLLGYALYCTYMNWQSGWKNMEECALVWLAVFLTEYYGYNMYVRQRQFEGFDNKNTYYLKKAGSNMYVTHSSNDGTVMLSLPQLDGTSQQWTLSNNDLNSVRLEPSNDTSKNLGDNLGLSTQATEWDITQVTDIPSEYKKQDDMNMQELLMKKCGKSEVTYVKLATSGKYLGVDPESNSRLQLSMGDQGLDNLFILLKCPSPQSGNPHSNNSNNTMTLSCSPEPTQNDNQSCNNSQDNNINSQNNQNNQNNESNNIQDNNDNKCNNNMVKLDKDNCLEITVEQFTDDRVKSCPQNKAQIDYVFWKPSSKNFMNDSPVGKAYGNSNNILEGSSL